MSATIQSRMTFPYARRVARQGYAVRRIGWTNKWVVWRGLWLISLSAEEREVQAGDITEDDIQAWDWTTAPVGCESASGPVDRTELLKVRPYDGLPVSGDPMAEGCALPAALNLGELQLPSMPVPGMVQSEDDLTLSLALGPGPNRLRLPDPPRGPEWLPTRRQRVVVPADPEDPDPQPDPVSLVITPTLYPCLSDGAVNIPGGTIGLTGGITGASYWINFGLYEVPYQSSSQIAILLGVVTLTPGQTVPWPGYPVALELDSSFVLSNTIGIVGFAYRDGVQVASTNLSVLVLENCGGGSGGSGE